MKTKELVERLDELLGTERFEEIDSSANGLQIGSGKGTIDNVVFAEDASMETIENAASIGADMMVVHHGITWGEIDRITGINYNRIQALIESGISLYVSHLPLDAHQEFGNAAGLAKILELEDREPFGRLGTEYIGITGGVRDPYTPDRLRSFLAGELDTGSGDVKLLKFGVESIIKIGIVTGAGGDWIGEAVEKELDVFITGEGKARIYHEAKELGVNVILAGHYATETFGVFSLEKIVSEWGMKTKYISRPTGL
jgi:dinuclear metal center YbgI/SA1388 family protein